MSERETALRAAWEAGFKLAVSYGDNWIHFDGDQKERKWKAYLAAQPVDAPQPCPHCKLPPVLPETCTPELGAVIDQQIADKWALLNAGVDIGQRLAGEAPQPCVWRKLPMSEAVQPDCQGEAFDAAMLPEDIARWKVCPYCGSPLSVVPAAQETTP